jgi:vacuolar-type H+-ATPase subunit F/Vma7
MQQKQITALAIVTFFLVTVFSLPNAHAQCKSFVKNGCLPQLAPYIHDGNYQAVIMSESEEAEVFKTVFAGQQYRLLVCTDDVLPDIEFVISDIRRNILFDNRKNGNVKIWDFKPEASQQIKITVRIPKSSKENAATKELIYGCVGVLFGLLE